MADVKALVDFTVEQTSVAVGDLLYVASAGTPAKVTFANLVDNNYTYSSTMTFSGTMTATGTIDVSGGTLTFGGTQDFVPKADASGNLVDGFGIETTLTDDDTKLATSGGVFDHVAGLAIGTGQTWTNVAGSRVAGTSYQNTTGRAIAVSVTLNVSFSATLQVSSDNSTWLTLATGAGDDLPGFVIVPPDHYYRVQNGFFTWLELT